MPAIDVLEKIASGVTAALAGGTFSQPFTAERSYADWELPLDDDAADDLRVDVVPVNNPATELESRDQVNYKAAADIVVRKKLNVSEQDPSTGRIELAKIDALVALVLEIHQFFLAARLASYDSASWDKTEVRAAYIPKHLRQHRQFTGIVRVTFDASVTR